MTILGQWGRGTGTQRWFSVESAPALHIRPSAMKLAPMASLACLAVAVGLWPASARADVVEWLYDVDVAVGTTASGEVDPRRAAGSALRELLVRMTGLKPLPNTAAVRGAIANPDRYYAQYGFVTRPAARVPEDDPAADATETRLAVRFDTSAVLDLLRSAELPIWGQDRPRVLIWLVLDREHRRREVASAGSGDIPAKLHEAARQRGLLVELPLLDLPDQALAPADLWGGFGARVDAASRRYDPDVLVVARLHEGREGAWTVDWRLRDPGDRASEARDLSYAADETESLRWAIDRTADELGRRLAVTGTSTDVMQLVVTGADTPPAYGAVLRYLASREYLEQVDVVGWAGTSLELALHARTDASRVRGLLSLGGMFAIGDSGVPSAGQPSAHMVWRGAR
ncbi:MAG: DUF2066 domain-containing protein [Gammaproteobacteria bacterium]|nr:DUF2066 domain-containing protein [Gammaproteobacteria bacterium]